MTEGETKASVEFDLTGAQKFVLVGAPDSGEAWYVLADGLVVYQPLTGAPRQALLSAGDLERGTTQWKAVD